MLAEEELKWDQENEDLERQIKELEEQLERQEEEERQQLDTQKELDTCLGQIKELGEKLKKDRSYIQFGYVVK